MEQNADQSFNINYPLNLLMVLIQTRFYFTSRKCYTYYYYIEQIPVIINEIIISNNDCTQDQANT